MSEAKHTPGPWRIGTPPPNGEQTIGTQSGLMVAVATTGYDVQTMANARLISAAPDLLEALYAVLHDCDNLDMVESNEPGRNKSAYEMIHAAIAKATKVQT